jgi:predicted Zn finger-like uncharacterized protein
MKFFCDNCQAQYMISDEKVGVAGVRVRCKKCQHVIYVKQLIPEPVAEEKRPTAAEDLPSQPTPPSASASSGIFSSETPAEAQRFEAEIGQALDSVFAEGGVAAAAPQPSTEEPQGAFPETDSGLGGSDGSSTPEDSYSAPAAAGASGHGVQTTVGVARAVDWFIAVRDEQVGPLQADEIKDRFERGEVGSDTLVWSAGLPDWRPLSTVQELAQMLVPRAAITRSEASTSNPRGEMPKESTARKEAPAFKPSAASALASLASMAQEEIAAAARATPAPPAAWLPGPEVVARPAASPGLAPEPRQAAPAAAAAHSVNGRVPVGEERPSYASYAASRPRGSRMRNVLFASAAIAVLAGAAFTMWLVWNQQKQQALFAEQLAAQLAQKQKEAEAPRPATPAVAPAVPPPAPAAPVAAAAPPGVAPVPAEAAKIAAAEPAGKHGKGRKGVPARVTPGQSETTPPPAPKPAAPSNSEDFLAGAGESAIDKEFARELDGNAAPEGKKVGAKHAPYIPPPPGQTDLPQQLSQSDIIGVVAQHKDTFGRCVQEQKKRDPTSSGTVVMHWRIKPDGHPSDVAAAPGDYQDSPLAACFKGQIAKLRFGQYRGTPMAPIQFPFNF